MMTMMIALCSFLLLLLLTGAAPQEASNAFLQEDCEGGACPSNLFLEHEPQPQQAENNTKPLTCGLWLGPSPIKNHEEHGFGLGIFTGKSIPKGSTVESLYYSSSSSKYSGEVLLALYGSETIYETHPPLREYVWDEDNLPEVAVEYPIGLTALFVPGLAAIAPCTSVNYNLEIQGTGLAMDNRDSVRSGTAGTFVKDRQVYHHWATAGSFSYRQNVAYKAVRDIAPGEELTVQCSDDNFDGGAYYLSTYDFNDDTVACLDQYITVDQSTISGAGKGLFSRKNVPPGTTLISTPLIPIHRKEMYIDDQDVNQKQLMLNYCYGRVDSDLLLLPYGPLVNFLNNAPRQSQQQQQQHIEANAKIRWHSVKKTRERQQQPLERRQQYNHHEELFQLSAEKVAITHGKGLMMDVVALREIQAGEEILIDYGDEWNQAWEDHVQAWNSNPKKNDDAVSAEEYIQANGGEMAPIRTNQEQQEDDNGAYPENLEFFCFYEVQEDNQEAYYGFRKATSSSSKGGDSQVVMVDWKDDFSHSCFRPCQVLERHVPATRDSIGNVNTNNDDNDSNDGHSYTVQLDPKDDGRVVDWCVIGRRPYIVSGVPRRAIRIMDKPFTTDVFRKDAFRHEIGVPEGFYPESWRKKKLRTRTSSGASSSGGDKENSGDEFKRKKGNPVFVKA